MYPKAGVECEHARVLGTLRGTRPSDKRMRKTVLALLLLAGCASAPPAVRVTFEELPADRWRVTYDLPAPAESMVFTRPRRAFRSVRWTIAEPAGARWETADGHEVIRFAAPASRAVVELATDLESPEKDYQVHVAFSEGSRLLYTGHFLVKGAPNALAFRSSRPVRVPPGEDTFVYFGSIKPVESERMTLIVDPGLPPWIARQLAERVPPTFDYFAGKMGTELGFRPLVYVNYGGSQGSGTTFKGGTVGRVAQIEVSGPGWAKESPDTSQLWYGRVAHEVFHLWESARFTQSDDTEWLGEASSEYAMLQAMRDAKVIDERQAHGMVVDAANQCIGGIGDSSLLESGTQGRFRNVYTCGLVSQWMAASATGNAWTLYRRTFDRPRPYTTADYVETLRAMSNDTAAIEQLISGKTDDPAAFFEEQLKRTGIQVSRDSKGRLRLD